MTTLDLLIGFAAVVAAIGGYRFGLVARASSWIGLLLGLIVSTRLVGPAVGLFDRTGELSRLLIAVAVMGGCALVGEAIGTSIGTRLRYAIPPGPSRVVDSLGGAAAGTFGLLVVVWLLLPTLGLVPGVVARAARNSAIVRFVDGVAPEPPAAVRDLSERVSEFDFPQVFAGMAPAPDVGPAPAKVPVPAAIVDRTAASTVNVEATGCGGVQEGSGFFVEPDLVATNAHVVAGADSVRLVLHDGSTASGRVVTFDDDRDLALISVDEVRRPALPLAQAEIGEGAAVFGHPGGQDELRVAPATVSEEIDAVGRDIYNDGRVPRRVVVLAADLQRGDSGSAVVDATGNAIGVVFAIAPDRPGTAYALSISELRAVLGAPRSSGAATGACL